MKSAVIPTESYTPGTRLEMPLAIGVEYTPVEALFELVDKAGEVIFRYRAGVSSDLAISGQNITVSLAPNLDSLDALGNTLDEAMALAATRRDRLVDWHLDLHQTGSDIVDYRFRGDFEVEPAFGPDR